MSGFFGKRLAPFYEYAAEENAPVIPPLAEEMEEADRRIDAQVTALAEALAGPAKGEVAELGRLVAQGEMTPAAVKKKLEGFGARSLPTGSGFSRVQTVCAAAREEYQRLEDKPEYAVSALRKSCLPVLRDEVDARLRGVIEAWGNLPGTVQEEVLSGPGGVFFVGLLQDVDVSEISGEELEARRALEAAWHHYEEFYQPFVLQWLMGVDRSVGMEPSQEYLPDYDALVFDATGCAVLATGRKVEELVATGQAEGCLEVLADPFGADKQEYQARVDAIAAVRSWRFAFNDHAAVGALHRGNRAILKARKDMSAGQVEAAMREEGAWAWD
ncbi:hypothetical protein [Corynebacterium lowii]|uniref:Uncharacterized protein n=1 Tax=Corynebacterium lowii TaxID=1544413 RepID=A0A0Q0YJR6_9CORY|nr:hypothetical protein [Corynebacterium lowii]KQB87056.1 hypothetical protein Clow_00103 [Corynebacterium lowii]MDP9852361.1 hypothetical protein [Corynebacterium lowii]